jgi:Mor family transcriptional regulator
MKTASDVGVKFLEELAAHVAYVSKDMLGVSAETADILGEEVALHIQKTFQKQPLYIPENRIFNALRTHELIAAQLGKKTATELAIEFGVCRQHIYKVAKRVTEAEKARRQGKLLLD